MKLKTVLFSTVAALLSAVYAITLSAQAPAQPPAGAPAQHHHEHEAPKNLQVLPKSMNGEQVHDLMHKWEGALGTECSHCHAVDPTRKGPNGRPVLNYADDSKPEKATARLMYKMVEEINTQYIGKIDNSGLPVTCGTCHRGHESPPPFAAPPDHDHDHDHPAEAKPPVPR